MSEFLATHRRDGYFYALGRFDQAVGPVAKFPVPLLRDRLFVALIEALLWLDMLFDHPETTSDVDEDFRKALGFVRARSRHAWAEAFAFRPTSRAPCRHRWSLS